MDLNLTPELLRAAVPQLSLANATRFAGPLNNAMRRYAINTSGAFSKPRIAAFLAQIGHETLSFTYFTELASGRAYDPDVNPRLAAELGNTVVGDGPRYKGRGAIQITGKYNYQKITEAYGIDFVNSPELAASLEYAFEIAGWFWNKNKLNALADSGQFEAITRKINGGLKGQPDRLARFEQAKRALATAVIEVPKPTPSVPGAPVTPPEPVPPPSVAQRELPLKPIMWVLGALGATLTALGLLLRR